MSLATLGPITFEVSSDKALTWQEAKRTVEARWATLDVFGAKPLREFKGPGNATITLPVQLDLSLGVVPRDELRRMRDLCGTGEAMDFSIGGELAGQWTIDRVTEGWKRMTGDGVILFATVDLELQEYN